MLWYKAWLETRSRFLIGSAVMLCTAISVVLLWTRAMELLPLASSLGGGELAREIQESAELSREYRGYIWTQWFRQNGTNMGTLFAALLGAGGLLSQRSGVLFTLSLPVSRKRLLSTRIVTGLLELLGLSLGPALLISMVSPAIGKTYSIADALIHGSCVFIAATVFFSLAFLLSTVFNDLWRPPLLTLLAALLLGFLDSTLGEGSPFSIFSSMNGELYFRTGSLPWLGLLICIASSAAMLQGSAMRTERQDF